MPSKGIESVLKVYQASLKGFQQASIRPYSIRSYNTRLLQGLYMVCIGPFLGPYISLKGLHIPDIGFIHIL